MNRNLNIILIFFILLFLVTPVFGKSLSYYIKNNFELVVILLAFLFIFIVLIIVALIYFNNLKKENIVRLYLNIENMWNSPSMIESRQKCAEFITDELLHSDKIEDKEKLRHSRVIIDFFNHLGLQVYNGLIDFSYVYNLLGNEILDYWDRRNYKLLVAYDKHKVYPTDLSPWVGFEYLADLCEQEKEYLRGRLWLPAFYPPLNYQQIEFKRAERESGNDIGIAIAILMTLIAIIIFIYSYLNYIS